MSTLGANFKQPSLHVLVYIFISTVETDSSQNEADLQQVFYLCIYILIDIKTLTHLQCFLHFQCKKVVNKCL